MQTDNKELYKLTSARTGKDEILYKDVGNFVFAELASMLRKPKSLIIKLRGVGFWFLRRKRLFGVLKMYPADWEKKQEEFSSEYAFLKNENKKEIHSLFMERLKEYEEYASEKTKIRQERNKTQALLTPKKDESEDNS